LIHLDALEKANSQLKAQNEELNKRYTKVLRDSREMESRNVTLKASNDALTKPRTTSAPPKALQSQQIRPNQLLSYFDGAVTVNAQYISRTGACLATNMDNECKFIEVGKLLQFRVGDKRYAFRVDETSVWSDLDKTREENTAKITILLLGDS
jgi:hypothetical protein